MNVDTDTEDEEVTVDDDEDGIAERRIELAQQSADCAVAFYRQLRARLVLSEDAAMVLTVAWIRGGML